ncbi:MAG TPA: hypothetical protein VF277_09260 [Steroidobacteraceae bacterium]
MGLTLIRRRLNWHVWRLRHFLWDTRRGGVVRVSCIAAWWLVVTAAVWTLAVSL